MTQQEIIEAIRHRKGFTSDKQLAEYLGLGEKGAIARMKIGKAGKPVYHLCKVILNLLNKEHK